MPTTNITYDEMKKLVEDGHVCARCGKRLEIAWINNDWALRCENINHSGITRHDKKCEQKIKEHMNMDNTTLTTMTETKMIERVNMARFPKDLNNDERLLIARVAINYGLDPLMNELTLYQGQPHVTIDGRYRKAQETGELDGVETRPATKEERESWEIPDGDYFFRAEVYRLGASRPFVGWGRVFKSETIVPQGKQPTLPVQKNPQRMAEKRAEAQGLRKGFHINLPSAEDIGSPEDTGEDAPLPKAVVRVVDEPKVYPSSEAANGYIEPDKYKRDPQTIKTLDDLTKALEEDFKLDRRAQLKELNLTYWTDLKLMPADAYIQVAASRK